MAVVRKISNQSGVYYQCRNPVEGIALNHVYKSDKKFGILSDAILWL